MQIGNALSAHRISPSLVERSSPPNTAASSSGKPATKLQEDQMSQATISSACRRPSGIETMTSQGSAHGRFQLAIRRRNLFQAELAIREMGTLSLLDALDYLDLLAEVRPEKLERAAIRWHGRLETEAATLTLPQSQLALAALASLCAGERDAVKILRAVVRRARPTLLPRMA
ncbi:MAG TPA: hypothetical protein VE736_02030 [Gaiellaceae bacterium]|jgi:hypothetical protein|nr:hypothetical protein [Gaiellaceae bacterium]